MWHLGGYETATWTPNVYIFLSAMCSLVHSDPKKYPGTCPDRNAPPQRPGNIQNLFRFAVLAGKQWPDPEEKELFLLGNRLGWMERYCVNAKRGNF